MSNWGIYLIRCSDNTYYCGITTNIKKRIQKHNLNKGAKYTKGRTPVKLIKYKIVGNKSIALKIEYNIKQLKKEYKQKYFFKIVNKFLKKEDI